MRSHPPSLITLTRALAREHALLPRGSRVLVAVSGGPDSMALLHVLARLRRDAGVELVAHGVDHGLRVEAAAELDLAESLARSLDVAFARTRVKVARGGNLQARARDARYDALEQAARSSRCDRIATAHHADDRAETVLLRLMRGAGPRGLAVLPPRAPAAVSAGGLGVDRVRPFLRARRRDITAHLERHHIAFASDPSNIDAKNLRVRARLELLPLLERLSPAIVEHLCALADQLAELTKDEPVVALPRATRVALAALTSGKTPRARVSLPGGLVAHIAGDQVVKMDILAPFVRSTPRRRRTRGGS